MRVDKYTLSVTTVADGSGTATTGYPLNGYVDEIRYGGTTLAGTATFTFTRVADGGTILAYTATAAPWTRSPRQAVHDNLLGGALVAATGGSALADRVPVDGYVQLVVANAGSVLTDDVSIFVC